MSDKLTCQECGAENPDNSKFCILCGNEFKSEHIRKNSFIQSKCKSCGVDLLDQAKFCHSCGVSVNVEKLGELKPKQAKGKSVVNLTLAESFVPVLITVLLFIAAGFILTGLASNEFDVTVDPQKTGSSDSNSNQSNQHNHPKITADAETLTKIETLKAEITSAKDKTSKQKYSSDLAEIYMKLGRMVEAADILIGFLPLDPKNEQIMVTIANLLDDGGEKQKAIEYYKKVLELNPKNVDARVDMATILISSESPMMAIAELKKVLEIKPDHQIANLNMGIMSYTVGKYDKALEWFQKAKNIDPNSTAGKKAAEGITAIESINNKSKTK